MTKQLPLRIFHTVPEIQSQWQISHSEISQWLMQGNLKGHVWLPLLSYYEITEELDQNRILQTRTLCHRDGYLPLFPYDCRNLLQSGQLHVRDFQGDDLIDRFELHETLQSIVIKSCDLVILEKEKIRFEKDHDLTSRAVPTGRASAHHDSTFKIIHHQGREHCFGKIQAAILRQLFEASKKDSPWISGKQLLAEVGSQSYTLANVFKRRPVWRQLIDSNEKGSYRLNPLFTSKFHTLE